MYRRVLPLLLTAVLLLSGCTAGQKNMPQKTDEKEMTGQPSDMSGEGSMYMDTTENVIYLAGGCFWGMEQLMQSIPGVIDAESGYANGTCEADADYKSVCGWPAFTKPIEEPAVVELEDLSHGMRAQRSEAVPEILTLVMYSPASRSPPMACATASTVRPCALCLTQR